MKTLIIVPAYNESLNIQKTIHDITSNTNFDYIIINDSSKDNTLEVCKKNNFKVLTLPANFGLTSAIQLGMKYAHIHNYDIAIQFDGDGQHKAIYLQSLVDAIQYENCDIVIGSRFVSIKRPTSLRMLGSILISFAIRCVKGKIIKDPTSGMRAYNKKVIEEFSINSSLTPEPDTLVYFLKKGYHVKEVQVEMDEREHGESYLNFSKSIEYMMNMFLMIIFIRGITRGRK